MSEALINRLVESAESGNQQKISLNGQIYSGLEIMEITVEALLISTGYADKSGKMYGFNLADLRPSGTVCFRTIKTISGPLIS